MNYCFNCGAKIDYRQKFCIQCGSNLKERKEKHASYNKEYRKKFNPRPGESYKDYLNRINPSLNDADWNSIPPKMNKSRLLQNIRKFEFANNPHLMQDNELFIIHNFNNF